MREIKFKRVYQHNKTGLIVMRTWGNIDNNDNSCLDFSSFRGPSINSNYLPIIDLQFTGLKDKNGKEIYEGDIITFINGNCIHTWGDNSDIRVIEVNPETKQLGWQGSGYSFCENNCKTLVEVIGNIYENPELLK